MMGPLKLGEEEGAAPSGLRASTALLTPGLQISGLQTVTGHDSVAFSHSACKPLSLQTWEAGDLGWPDLGPHLSLPWLRSGGGRWGREL